MLKQRRLVAEQVAETLFESEAAIDAALAAAAKLAGIIPLIRADANLSALIGQSAIEKAIESVSALGVARRAVCEAHQELTIAQRDIGLRAVSFGGGEKPPAVAHLTGIDGARTAAA
ncbi:hypothetical protein [Caulobacter sp. NIBR2454]|uniref:hypothetical protein n=1 Tax=Caulobacter sp. NIBR2454 TaxID=3015996 RepID=UPI0022B61336|nr:hypothetical protein [Caulobacter sp. NIBR2454]